MFGAAASRAGPADRPRRGGGFAVRRGPQRSQRALYVRAGAGLSTLILMAAAVWWALNSSTFAVQRIESGAYRYTSETELQDAFDHDHSSPSFCLQWDEKWSKIGFWLVTVGVVAYAIPTLVIGFHQTQIAHDMGYWAARQREALDGMQPWMWSRLLPDGMMILGALILFIDLGKKAFFLKKEA